MLQSRVRRGHLDQQIVFVKKIIGTGAANEDALDGWELIDTDAQVWAKVTQRPGREVVVANQIQSIMNTSFIIDYRTDITPENRVIYRGKYFNIISPPVEHEGSREGYMLIVCDEVPNEVPTIYAT